MCSRQGWRNLGGSCKPMSWAWVRHGTALTIVPGMSRLEGAEVGLCVRGDDGLSVCNGHLNGVQILSLCKPVSTGILNGLGTAYFDLWSSTTVIACFHWSLVDSQGSKEQVNYKSKSRAVHTDGYSFDLLLVMELRDFANHLYGVADSSDRIGRGQGQSIAKFTQPNCFQSGFCFQVGIG